MRFSNLVSGLALSLCLQASIASPAHAASEPAPAAQSPKTASDLGTPITKGSLMGLRPPQHDSSGLSNEARIYEAITMYARAGDMGDIETLATLFTPDLITENFLRRPDGSLIPAGTVGRSREVILQGAKRFQAARGAVRIHHYAVNPVIEIKGNTARMNTQFLVTRTTPAPITSDGQPDGESKIEMTLTGHYDDVLKKVDGRWLIAEHRVILDNPIKLPK